MAKNEVATERRVQRVRRALKKAANGRPRLSVFRSSKQIYAQIIDDANGITIAAASTLEKDVRGKLKTGADIAAAAEIGKLGEPVATEELRPGDLVFFNTLGRSLSHVGIYIGNNEFIHAGSRGTPRAVRINRLDQNYFSKRFEGARRLLP